MPDSKDNVVTMPGRPVADMSQAVKDAFGMSGRRYSEEVAVRKLEAELGAPKIAAPIKSAAKATVPGVAVPGVAAKKSKPQTTKEAEHDDTSFGVKNLAVTSIRTSPFQTREFDDEETIEELARSIEQKGIIQPIIVRLTDSGDVDFAYELVAGERRLRAAQRAGLQEVPALVYDLEDREALELSIIENAQRENLNPIEEALAIQQLSMDFKMNQSEIAEVIGKSRVAISNALRLLNLAPEVIEYLKTGELSAGHGRALLALKDQDQQFAVARRAINGDFSVRKLEAYVAQLSEVGESEEVELSDEEIKALAALERQESKLRNLLELEQVSLKLDNQGRKRLSLVFDSEAAWKRFMSRVRD